MYKVIVSVKNPDLFKELTEILVWGEMTEFEIAVVSNSISDSFEKLKTCRCDLMIAESEMWGEEEFRYLKLIKAEGLCYHIALCSMREDFKAARQGMIIGAYEYFVSPLESSDFISLFNRIKNETYESQAVEIYYVEEIAEYFNTQNTLISEHLEELTKTVFSENGRIDSANIMYSRIIDGLVTEIFSRFEWLDLFLNEEHYHSCQFSKNNTPDEYAQWQNRRLLELFEKFCELYPSHNLKIHDVILYILNNPESDLRQKTLSDTLKINSTYLSTMFTAQTDIRFIDYITNIKLTRAAWLLDNTKMKITEIAGRLDYKDIGYFSRQFKKKYSLTPSEYRILDNYSFEI